MGNAGILLWDNHARPFLEVMMRQTNALRRRSLTLMTRQREKGTVTRMRNTERAVRRNAVKPRPSDSAAKEGRKLGLQSVGKWRNDDAPAAQTHDAKSKIS